jgi:prepilin-type processing-associated H-X9-DG protein
MSESSTPTITPSSPPRKRLAPLLAISAALAALTFAGPLPLMCAAPVLGAGCATFVLVRAIRQRSAMMLLALALLVTHATFGLHSLKTADRRSRAALLCCELQHVGSSLRLYVEHHACFPPNLDALVREDLCTPRQLLSRADPNAHKPRPSPPFYTSYVYQPGVAPWIDDAQVVLLYERTAHTCALGGLRGRPGHAVLFADGHAEMLDKAAFRTALETDRRRRAEIGWPTAEPEPGVLAPAKP